MEQTLLIATGNTGKVREIKAILSSLDLDIISVKELGGYLDVKETGKTYVENALIKAKAYQQRTGKIVLADDSGLEIDALFSAPGIFSARYSSEENASDADRRTYLLHQLEGIPQPWTAHFQCAAVLVTPDGNIIETSGRCDGEIIPEARGTHGFGYDPIFFIPEFDATMAEISPAIKNKISHRARALTAMIPALKSVFSLNYSGFNIPGKDKD